MANLSTHTYVLSFNRGSQPTSTISSALVDQMISQFAGKPIRTVVSSPGDGFKFSETPVGELASVLRTHDGNYIATCLLNNTIDPAQFAIEPVYAISSENRPYPYCLVLRPATEADSYACFFYSPDAQPEAVVSDS